MTADPDELLHRHVPVLRLDSGEPYRPTAVEAFLEGRAGGAERVYGRAARGGDGRVWLAYWYFYPVNDYTLFGPFLHVGRHEGDWEMVQLRLGPDDETPELLLAAQHARVGAREWSALERTGPGEDRPVLYPARGCHANWFSAGRHWSGAWWDRADGRGPELRPELEILTDQAWIDRPGRWGATPPRTGWRRRFGAAASPHGPGRQRQWRDPAVLLGELAPRR